MCVCAGIIRLILPVRVPSLDQLHLEIKGVCSTPSLQLLPSPLRPGVVIFFTVLSMDQIGLLKNYSYSIGPCTNKNIKKNLHKYIYIYIYIYKERDSLTSEHKITLEDITCH